MGIGDTHYRPLGGLGGSQTGPRLEKELDPNPRGTCRVLGWCRCSRLSFGNLVGLTNAWRWLYMLLAVSVDNSYKAC